MSEEQKPKHTAGPWVNVGAVGCSTGIATADHWVALVYGNNVNPFSDADAALIAAAPELLEACKAAKKYLEPYLVEPGRTVFWALVSAIRKAEGRNA